MLRMVSGVCVMGVIDVNEKFGAGHGGAAKFHLVISAVLPLRQ